MNVIVVLVLSTFGWVLTATAWRKGWGPRALVPVGVAATMAWLAGLLVGLLRLDPAVPLVLGGAALLDLAWIGVLVVLNRRSPRHRHRLPRVACEI